MSSNPLDSEAGTELFSSYEAEYKLVVADLTQKLDQIAEQQQQGGEARKAKVSAGAAERAVEEAAELLAQMKLEKQNMPSGQRTKVNQRLRNYESDLDGYKRRLRVLTDERSALFGGRYTGGGGNGEDGSGGADGGRGGGGGDQSFEQRQQLLSGTDRLDRSTQRLKASQALANQTEAIGANTLADLHRQRETILHTNDVLLDSEAHADRSIKTLRGMARRMATNRVITITIITILVLLIIAVIYSKFR